MDTDARMRDAEARFLEIVEESGLVPPDGVVRDGEDLVFRWNQPKLVVVVDCSEGAAEPALGIGGFGQA